MRNIPVNEWIVKNLDKPETKENLILVLGILVNNKKPEDIPRGFEQFKLYTKLIKAFEKAEETKMLKLEEKEYAFLRATIEKDIPSIWGINKNIVDAIEIFMNAKEE